MRVALVSGPDPGHLLPVAGLAQQLQAVGHEVLVVTSDRWAAALGRDGLGYLSLPLIDRAPGDHDMGHRLHARAVQMGLPLAAELRGLGLDLVVSDTLTRAGAVAATVLDLPWVELIPHSLPDPSVALPPFGTGWEPRPRRDRRYARRNAVSLRVGQQQKHAALAEAGLVDVPPVQRLVTTLPALEPPRPDWPARTTVVAPPTWEPAEVDLAVPAGSGPLLLVVGSTASGGHTTDLLAAVVADPPPGWRVVSPRFEAGAGPSPGLAAGPGRRAAGPSPWLAAGPPPWLAAGPGRLAPLLAAAHVTLAPGGHGTVAASLRAGVPMVLIPGRGDQKEVAARVARAGAGVRLNRLRRSAFRRALDAALGMGAAARRAGETRGLPDPVPLLEAATR